MTVTQFNREALDTLLIQEPLVIARQEFGEVGVAKIKSILYFLKKSARFITLDEKSSLTVFALMSPDKEVDELRVAHASKFQFGVTALGSVQNLIVEIREDGSPFVWQNFPVEIDQKANTAVAYRLIQSVERFSLNGVHVAIQKVIEDAVSQFCVNSFTDLRQALIAYRDSMARTSKCHILRQAWADENRLWFRSGPEYRLRQALHNYLYSYLRHDDIDLREEQSVDDSHPVDVKIVWRMENRSAIIEVKWLGKSKDLITGKITSDYGDARARKGAEQLADYLEKHRQEAAKEDTRGYLVIFDCRRWGLTEDTKSVTKTDGMHYEKHEIIYNPEFHKTRQDFEEPIRMFLEPVVL